MEGLIGFGTEFIGLLSVQNIVLLCLCTIAGIVIGGLPGLTATMGIALLSGLTYGLETETALIVLIGVYVGAIYGGSISAILIGIPGTGSAAATVLDGHPMARQGKGGRALSAAVVSSFIGTAFGMLCLAVFTPVLESLALEFTSPEFALLGIFGVTICGSLTGGKSAVKGWIGGFTGLLIGCIGYDAIYSFPRLTFGIRGLNAGIAFVTAMIGLFGIPSFLLELSHRKQAVAIDKIHREPVKMKEIKSHLPLILRSGLIGTGIGAIPGVGEDVAAWMAYDTAKKNSDHPEQFGRGSLEGIMAAETANNAAIGGSMIPLLSLAVPGSAPAAVLLGALYLHGIRPGPLLAKEQPTFIYFMCALLLLAGICMRVWAVPICRLAPRVLSVPAHVLMPIVAVLAIIGGYAININLFDLYVLFFFGLLGFISDRLDFPPAPIVLGVILSSLVDSNIRRTLLASQGNIISFFNRPICLILWVLIIYSMLCTQEWFQRFQNRLFRTVGSRLKGVCKKNM